MKYVALLTNLQDEIDSWAAMSTEEAQTARAEEVPKWEALFNELGPAGVVQFGAELDVPATAKTVRVRDGETIVTDGPYAETKEQIGGVVELDCEDLDHAISIAARIPLAAKGSVELRPVIEH